MTKHRSTCLICNNNNNNINMSVNKASASTPGPSGKSGKRPIDETISPSQVSKSGHVGSPYPLRRKGSLPDLHTSSSSCTMQPSTPDTTSVFVQGKNCNMVDMIKTALASPQVLEAIADSFMPKLTLTLEANINPLKEEIKSLNQTISNQRSEIEKLTDENKDLRHYLNKANTRIDEVETAHDDLEQYGRRAILRFHRVPIDNTQTQSTDQVIIKLCNDKLGVSPPITPSDIDRSHILGKVDKGTAQIICKFTTWNTKFRVFQCKKNLKNHKTTTFNVFITEDLSAKRRAIVQCLNEARKTKQIFSFWTSDGRIFYKNEELGMKIQVKGMDQVAHLIPDPNRSMTADPWNTNL